jgi:hypothetical protein
MQIMSVVCRFRLTCIRLLFTLNATQNGQRLTSMSLPSPVHANLCKSVTCSHNLCKSVTYSHDLCKSVTCSHVRKTEFIPEQNSRESLTFGRCVAQIVGTAPVAQRTAAFGFIGSVQDSLERHPDVYYVLLARNGRCCHRKF